MKYIILWLLLPLLIWVGLRGFAHYKTLKEPNRKISDLTPDEVRAALKQALVKKKDSQAQELRWTTIEETRPKVLELLEKHETKAIKIYRPYPANPPHKETSYLGGLPLLPPHIEWPKKLHFLAQINLSELPKNNLLPDTGVLFFFAGLGDDGVYRAYDVEHRFTATKVIYAENFGSVERAVPADMPDRLTLKGLKNLKLFQKWPIRFYETNAYKQDFSQEFYNQMADKYPGTYNFEDHEWENDFWTVYDREIEKRSVIPKAVKAEIGQRKPFKSSWMNYIPSSENVLVFPGEINDQPFPQAGIFVSDLMRHIIHFADDKFNTYEDLLSYRQKDFERKMRLYETNKTSKEGTPKPKPQYKAPNPIYGRDVLEKIKSEAIEWQEQAIEIGDYTSFPSPQREAFLNWLTKTSKLTGPKTQKFSNELTSSYILNASAIQRMMQNSLFYLIQKSVLDEDLRSFIPTQYYEDILHYYRGESHTQVQHRLLGHPPAHWNLVALEQSDVLILHLFSDYGVNFMFGDAGSANFYINKDDLAKRNFDKAWGIVAK